MRTLQTLGCTLLLLSVCPSVEAHPPLSARNLFLAGRDQWIMFLNDRLAAADDMHFGLRCSIVDRTRSGIVAEHRPDFDIVDDRVQLRLETNADSYLYVLQKGADHWTLLFPRADTIHKDHHISAPRNPRTMTAASGWLTFGDEPESKQFFIILSRSPLQAIEQSLNSALTRETLGRPPGTERDRPEAVVTDGLVNGLRNSVRMWDLLFELADDSVYVVGRKAGGVSRVGMDLGLRRQHR